MLRTVMAGAKVDTIKKTVDQMWTTLNLPAHGALPRAAFLDTALAEMVLRLLTRATRTIERKMRKTPTFSEESDQVPTLDHVVFGCFLNALINAQLLKTSVLGLANTDAVVEKIELNRRC